MKSINYLTSLFVAGATLQALANPAAEYNRFTCQNHSVIRTINLQTMRVSIQTARNIYRGPDVRVINNVIRKKNEISFNQGGSTFTLKLEDYVDKNGYVHADLVSGGITLQTCAGSR